MHSFEEARESFKTHRAKVAVLGLGYAGLPLACSFAEAGFEVVALDIDEQKVQQLRKGNSYIPHIDSEWIRRLTVGGKLNASSNFGDLASCNAAIICVPTPLTDGRDPDLRHIIQTAHAIRTQMHRGLLVVLESTTYPGTTDEIVLPILAESGLLVGEDFFLAFSPEREDPANKNFTTRTIPKTRGRYYTELP